MKIFWDEVFVVRNSIFSIQYSAVIFRKRSDFEMQFCLIVLSFTFKLNVFLKIMGMALYARKKKGPDAIIHSGAFVGVFF